MAEVFVVDDIGFMRNLSRAVLEPEQLTVVAEAENGTEGEKHTTSTVRTSYS